MSKELDVQALKELTLARKKEAQRARKQKSACNQTIQDHEMECLLCTREGTTKLKKAKWLGEHLVSVHRVTLSQYIAAFYVLRDDDDYVEPPSVVSEEEFQEIESDQKWSELDTI